MHKRDNGSIAFAYRSSTKLLTLLNSKTEKGEKQGYLSALLYMMPHTSGGPKTLCPYSTPACREMCLAGAGLSGLKIQMAAKQRRTDLFWKDKDEFYGMLVRDIDRVRAIAMKENKTPCFRLNGTSDILWEREAPWLFEGRFADLIWYDYTKYPLKHRAPPKNYHLTFSVEGAQDMAAAVGYLRDGHSVAAVVPEGVKASLLSAGAFSLMGDSKDFHFVDGDTDDLRFRDSPGSVVLLKPKGLIRTSLIRPYLLSELIGAMHGQAA